MSDIDTQIENNKIRIEEFKQRIEELNRQIDNIKKQFQQKRMTKKDAAQQLKQIKNTREQTERNIDILDNINKQLSRTKSNDPFSRIYNPTNIPSDEDVMEEYENMREQSQPSLLNPQISSENKVPVAPLSLRPTPEEEQEVSRSEENSKKAQQQQQNLSERERVYEEKTGKKYNPLVTDDDEEVALSGPDNSIPLVSSSKTKRKTPTPPMEAISSKVNNNKTKKKRPTPEGIELDDLTRNRPITEQVPLEEDIEINEKHFTVQTGFRETLKPPAKEESIKLDENICKNIFTIGLKVNKGHFFPSQFPKLTRVKSITLSNKKGGKRKSRKNRKK